MITGQRFTKAERLRSKKIIDNLFQHGRSFALHPFRVIWISTDNISTFPVQVLIVASKKGLKRAVDRNKMKRLIREAYRKYKSHLYESLDKTNTKWTLAIIYTGKEISPSAETGKKINTVIQRLIEENEKGTG